MVWSKLKQDEVVVRRTELLRLRREGVRYDDERVEALGYSSPDSARRDLSRALAVHRDEERAEASVFRQQENERLDALLQNVWPRATKPSPILNDDQEIVGYEVDLRAVDTVLRLIDRRAKLNGLDMPVKTELSGPGGGAVPITSASVAELRSLINTSGDPDAEDDEDAGDGPEDGDADDDGDEA